MCIYLKNNPTKTKLHPDPIWNNEALGFIWRGHPNHKKKNKNEMGSDMGSVPNP